VGKKKNLSNVTPLVCARDTNRCDPNRFQVDKLTVEIKGPVETYLKTMQDAVERTLRARLDDSVAR